MSRMASASNCTYSPGTLSATHWTPRNGADETSFAPNLLVAAADSQVEQVVKCCEGCQKSAKSQLPNPMPKLHVTKPDHAWSMIGMDIAGLFSTVLHCKQFVVSVVDHYSGFLEVLFTMDICSSQIVTWLHTSFMRYGYPDELVCDNVPEFVSQEFQVFLEEGESRSCPPRFTTLSMELNSENCGSGVLCDGQTMGPGNYRAVDAASFNA